MKLSPVLLEGPYRLCFPLGIISLLWGVLLWLPLIWNPDVYPVLVHRYLVINGFAGLFIGGFLMTAVPRFSKTMSARSFEMAGFIIVTIAGIFFAYQDNSSAVFAVSALQVLIILFFLLTRIFKRKENPPYSFVFIFVGLFLWFLSSILSLFFDPENFRHLHHEGAIAAIILGVGGRLIPGILGHVEIVSAQREHYERPVSIIKTVPWHFWPVIGSFVVSYFLPEDIGLWVRLVSVLIVAVKYWKLIIFPKQKTALTWSIWTSSWFIVISFALKALWSDGVIHGTHSFFINGIVLMSLLIATRVLVSHGPKVPELEDSKILFLVTFLIILAAATRVSAFLMPDGYLKHLAYSSFVLTIGILIWSFKYLKYVFVNKEEAH